MRRVKGVDILSWIERARSIALTKFVRSSFAGLGRSTRIVFPCRLAGTERILIGSECFIYRDCWLQTIAPSPQSFAGDVALVIGDRVVMSGSVVISATTSVVVEDDVTMARGVFLADHGHARSDDGVHVSPDLPTPSRPVRVGAGAWLGQNAVVTPGVQIGAGAIVGANSVVTRDVPDGATVVGAPARIVTQLEARAAERP